MYIHISYILLNAIFPQDFNWEILIMILIVVIMLPADIWLEHQYKIIAGLHVVCGKFQAL